MTIEEIYALYGGGNTHQGGGDVGTSARGTPFRPENSGEAIPGLYSGPYTPPANIEAGTHGKVRLVPVEETLQPFDQIKSTIPASFARRDAAVEGIFDQLNGPSLSGLFESASRDASAQTYRGRQRAIARALAERGMGGESGLRKTAERGALKEYASNLYAGAQSGRDQEELRKLSLISELQKVTQTDLSVLGSLAEGQLANVSAMTPGALDKLSSTYRQLEGMEKFVGQAAAAVSSSYASGMEDEYLADQKAREAKGDYSLNGPNYGKGINAAMTAFNRPTYSAGPGMSIGGTFGAAGQPYSAGTGERRDVSQRFGLYQPEQYSPSSEASYEGAIRLGGLY